jgi:hypothetical protein
MMKTYRIEIPLKAQDQIGKLENNGDGLGN